MANAQLGNKFTCFKCSARFYDLGRPEPVCPDCGADQREDPNTVASGTPKNRRSSSKDSRRKPAPVVADKNLLDEEADSVDSESGELDDFDEDSDEEPVELNEELDSSVAGDDEDSDDLDDDELDDDEGE